MRDFGKIKIINHMDKKILLIDSDRFILKVLKYQLEKNKFIVYTAEDGKRGGELIESAMPDLIIMELILSPVDGFELLQKYNGRKIIVLSKLLDDKDKLAAMKLGALEFVSKEGIPTKTILRLTEKYLS
jgi:two-component system, OmpR family, alkaline phosphatase synthesis response regulator PhoP